ncbi:MAG: CoA transferase [Gemmatimonadota bacterium]|nr:CoA transferase [Gemmatimonadota bacterium]
MQVLEGIRVIDLTRVLAGPYATMILADLGAEVIKVESLTGDDSRSFGPFKGDVSGYFQSVNRGKKSVAIDLKFPAGKSLLMNLLAQSDILVENYRPGAMKRLGLDYETLRPVYPSLIYAACSGFGQTGPYSHRGAYDMIIQGMGGVISVTGEPDQAPVRVGISIGDLSASLFTAIGILSALHVRNQTGAGQMVDIGMLDCQVALLENAISRFDMKGEVPKPLGSRHPSITPFQAFQTSDAWLMLAIGNDPLWHKFCDVIETPGLIHDPRFRDNAARTDNHTALQNVISPIIKQRTTGAWIDLLEPLDIPCGPIHDVQQVVEDPQVNARDMILRLAHPTAGPLRMAGSPIKLTDTPGQISGIAPELGEHTDRVLSSILDLSVEEIHQLRSQNIIH